MTWTLSCRRMHIRGLQHMRSYLIALGVGVGTLLSTTDARSEDQKPLPGKCDSQADCGPYLACVRHACEPTNGPSPPRTAWWGASDLLDYGFLLGVSIGIARVEVDKRTTNAPALIGPSFDANRPAIILKTDPGIVSQIGKPYAVAETIPSAVVIGAIPVTLAILAVDSAYAGRGKWNPRRFHNTLTGFAEALGATVLMTETLKYGVGRLRPDFQDRAKRYYCNQSTSPQAWETICKGFAEGPLGGDPRATLEDGHLSFPSGHSSTSFALAAYSTWVIGGNHLWGREATPASRAAAIPAMIALNSLATLVAYTRVDDGRHHWDDVVVGGLIGAGWASIAYFRQFDIHGSPRGPLRFNVVPGPGIAGVSLAGQL